jgi:hypothetical protein
MAIVFSHTMDESLKIDNHHHNHQIREEDHIEHEWQWDVLHIKTSNKHIYAFGPIMITCDEM